MTIEEFNNTLWAGNMFALYKGVRYQIGASDFEEALVGLVGVVQGSDDLNWVRCENIEVVE